MGLRCQHFIFASEEKIWFRC